jgi:hypothetical protein
MFQFPLYPDNRNSDALSLDLCDIPIRQDLVDGRENVLVSIDVNQMNVPLIDTYTL